jgi:hypothetical protein
MASEFFEFVNLFIDDFINGGADLTSGYGRMWIMCMVLIRTKE